MVYKYISSGKHKISFSKHNSIIVLPFLEAKITAFPTLSQKVNRAPTNSIKASPSRRIAITKRNNLDRFRDFFAENSQKIWRERKKTLYLQQETARRL